MIKNPSIPSIETTFHFSTSTHLEQTENHLTKIPQNFPQISTIMSQHKKNIQHQEEESSPLTHQSHSYKRASSQIENIERQPLLGSRLGNSSFPHNNSPQVQDLFTSKKHKTGMKSDAHHPMIPSHTRECQFLPVEEFDKIFEEFPEVEMDDYEVRDVEDNEPLMTNFVGPCLALIVRYIENGVLLSMGVGHFSVFDIDLFKNSEETETKENPPPTLQDKVLPRRDRNHNLIKSFLDEMCQEDLTRSIEIFAFGMYDTEDFQLIQQRISQDYAYAKLTSLINPWNMPQNFVTHEQASEQLDFEIYKDVKGFSLRVGITPEGKIYFADESETNATDKIGENGFLQFNENDFVEWRKKI